MMVAEVFAYLQTKALETEDPRIQELSNQAFSFLDETVLRTVLIQKFSEQAAVEQEQQQQYQQQFKNNPFNRMNRR